MKRRLFAAAVFGAFGLSLVIGCEMRPSPPRTEDGNVPDVLYVRAGDDAERAAVIATEKARVNYKYGLEVLKEHLVLRGQLDQHEWATRELENLAESVTFRWGNIPEPPAPKGEDVAGTDAAALVEYTVAARKAYLSAVDELAQFYERRDVDSYKARRVRNMQARFFPRQTYMYFLEAQIPGPELRPTDKIPEADKLYEQGMELYEDGQIVPGITDRKKEHHALLLLQELVRRYPRSTKIALAAFYIAEIYKEYFNENILAVQWYERAWQWDPTITEAARFQAAVIYDIRLQDYTKALELYREALNYDPPRLGNASFCTRRIRQLIEQRKVSSEPRRSPKGSP